MTIDTALLHHVTRLADRRLAADLDRTDAGIGPRPRMAAILNAVCCHLNPGSSWYEDRAPVDAALKWTAELAAAQGCDGLFSIGGNIASAPDTAFVINDAVAAALLVGSAGTLPDLQHAVVDIIDHATSGLITGGIHTPNHRWEISAALAGADAVRSNPAARARAEQWLGEGIDIDGDGLYSERSANYAAYVSNPSLLTLAELLDRPDLADAVHRNLHAQVDLTGPDGLVETVFSRRQDQKLPEPYGNLGLDLGIFLLHFRAAAGSCSSCADTFGRLAERELAADAPIADPTTILSTLLSTPTTPLQRGRDAPADGERRTRIFTTARIAVVHDQPLVHDQPVHDQPSLITINAGSDVPVAGRVASGLACNPTFLRWRFTDLALDSVRLSRNFFGLGPFRAQRLDHPADDRFVLSESVSAGYYQPLPAAHHDDHGDYALQFEGRFAARMAFAERPRVDLTLSTTVDIAVERDTITLAIRADGPPTAQCLEFGFRPGGSMINAEALSGPTDRWLLSPGTAYRRDDVAIAITSTAPSAGPTGAFYRPGEAYEFLGGTDAVVGPRVYLPFESPGEIEVTLTATGQRR